MLSRRHFKDQISFAEKVGFYLEANGWSKSFFIGIIGTKWNERKRCIREEERFYSSKKTTGRSAGCQQSYSGNLRLKITSFNSSGILLNIKIIILECNTFVFNAVLQFYLSYQLCYFRVFRECLR